MVESDSGTFTKSLNVSTLASMFQQPDITLPVRPQQVMINKLEIWSPGEAWKFGFG